MVPRSARTETLCQLFATCQSGVFLIVRGTWIVNLMDYEILDSVGSKNKIRSHLEISFRCNPTYFTPTIRVKPGYKLLRGCMAAICPTATPALAEANLMLKLTKVIQSDREYTLQLEGSISGQWI